MGKCYLTGKSTLFGNKRSHAMNSSRRTWKTNLQKVRIVDQKGKVQKVLISARALKKISIYKNSQFKRF